MKITEKPGGILSHGHTEKPGGILSPGHTEKPGGILSPGHTKKTDSILSPGHTEDRNLWMSAHGSGLVRKHWCLVIIAVLCVLLGITLYRTSSQPPRWEPEPEGSSRLRVGFSQLETDNPWRTAQINSFREALLPNGMDFIYHEPEAYTVQWQLEDIRSLIQEKVDYLAIVPADLSALTPVLQDAKEAGIPVILIDQSAETIDRSYYVSLISADYLKEGQICASLLAERFGQEPCNIVEIYGTESSPGAQARSRGFHQALAQYPNLRVTDVEYGNFDRVTAQKAMENALIKASTRGQTIHAVFAHSDEDGLGALQAIKVAGLPPGEIAIVSINGIQDVCKAIIAGEYLGTVESNPRWGFLVAFLIQQMERGVKPFPTVMIPYQIITSENAAQYALTAY